MVMAALVTGLGITWVGPGRPFVLIVIAIILAAANGYSKAYSP